MNDNKKSITNKVSSLVDKLAGPMGKFGEFPIVVALKDGLVATIPIIIIGSIFLLIAMLGMENTFKEGYAIPAMASFSPKLLVIYSLTMNFMALYAAVSIGMAYGRIYNLDPINSAIISLGSFLLVTINGTSDNMISVSSFAPQGLFTAMAVSIFSVWIYRICIEKNLVIKMPKGVPQGIGNAFSALIPFTIVFIIVWLIRTVLNFDLVSFMATVLQPVFNAADNIVVFTTKIFTELLLWSTGMHGTIMLDSIFGPLKTVWIGENAQAISEGVKATELPHIWTNVTERMVIWVASAWGLMFWMWTSKLKSARAIAIAATPAAIFTIIEPLVFGLPIVFNPFLIIPFILSGTVAAFVTYGIFELGIINRVFVELPWATPPFIAGPLATGDWKSLLLVIINFLIGVVIYYPFWKAYERNEQKKVTENENSVIQE